MEVYYKPSYFKYSLRAWTEQELLSPAQTAEDVLTGGKKSSKDNGGGDAQSRLSKTGKKGKPEKTTTDLSSNLASAKEKNKKSIKGKEIVDMTKLKEDWPKNLRKSSFFYFCIL